MENTTILVEAATRLVRDHKTLHDLFPQLDPAGILNLALLLSTRPADPLPAQAPVAPTLTQPDEIGEPYEEPGLKALNPVSAPIEATNDPDLTDEYRLGLITVMGTGTYFLNELHGRPGLPSQPKGYDAKEWLRYALEDNRYFTRLGNNRHQVTPHGKAWADKVLGKRAPKGKGSKGEPPALPPAVAKKVTDCPALVGAIYAVLGTPMKAAQIVEQLRKKGWLMKSKKPLSYVRYVLCKNKDVFFRIPSLPGSRDAYYSTEPPKVTQTAQLPAPELPIPQPWKPTPKVVQPPLMGMMAAVMLHDTVSAVEITRRLQKRAIDLRRFPYPPAYLAGILSKQPTVFELVEEAPEAPNSRYRVIDPDKFKGVLDVMQS